MFLINNTNKLIQLRKGSNIGKIEGVKECNFVNVNDLNEQVQQMSLRVSSFDDLEQKIIVPINHRDRVEDLIEQNRGLFAGKDGDLGKTKMIKMSLDNGNHPPIKLRLYRTLFAKHSIVDKAANDMLAANNIHPSRSPWSFLIVVVDKKDCTKRFCTDFRKLNNISKKSSWPLPVTDNMLATLVKAKYFTTLDLKSGHWQIQLNEEDKEKMAFTCHRGLCKYNVMPFGLTSAPRIFQELMSVVLHGLENFAVAYLDDVIISISEEEHKQHIQYIFDSLRQHSLKLSKCKFMQKETHIWAP